MNTHDIELPEPFGEINLSGYDASVVMFYPKYDLEHVDVGKRLYTEDQIQAAVEADRKRRGETVAYAVFSDDGNIRIWSNEPLDWREPVPLYSAPQPATPSATDTNDGTKSDDPVGGEYPSNEWVTAFFGSPDDSGFYYFRGDFGNIAHRYKNSAKHLLPQPAEPTVKESLTVPDGWQLVPIGLTEGMRDGFRKYINTPAYHSPDGCYSAFLKAAPIYSGSPKRLQDMSKAELIDLIEQQQQELDAIGAGGVSGKQMR